MPHQRSSLRKPRALLRRYIGKLRSGSMADAPVTFHPPAWAAPPLPGIPVFLHEVRSGALLACHDVGAVGKARVTLGRSSSCDICLDSKSLSRTHAILVLGEDGRAAIADLGSKKGTLVDGVRLKPLTTHSLLMGAVITLGDCSRRLLLSNERAPALPPRLQRHKPCEAETTGPGTASHASVMRGMDSIVATRSESGALPAPISAGDDSAPAAADTALASPADAHVTSSYEPEDADQEGPVSSLRAAAPAVQTGRLHGWLSDPSSAVEAAEKIGVPLERVSELQGHSKPVTGLVIDAAGARVTTASADCSLRLWDLHAMDASLRSFRTVEPADVQPIVSLSASPSGALLLVTDGSHQPRVLDREGGKRLLFAAGDPYVRDARQTRGHTAAATCGAWHPEKEHCVLTAGVDGAARLWDIGAAERVEALKSGAGPGPGARRSKLVRSRVKDTMAMVNPFGELFCGRVLTATAGTARFAPARDPSAAAAAAASPGRGADELDTAGRRRRTGPERGPGRASAATAAPAREAADYGVDAGGGSGRPPVTSVAWSPDGRHAVLGVATGAVQLWDTRSNMALPALQRADAHAPGLLSFVGYAPGGSGHSLASRSGGDGCVRVWDVRALRREPVLALRGVRTRSPWANVCWAADRAALVLGTGRGAAAHEPTPLWVVGVEEAEAAFREAVASTAAGARGGVAVEAVAAAALCSWGAAGSELVVWHESLRQLLVGCGDGVVRGVWSEALSRRGLREAFGRGVRSTGVVVADAPATVSSADMQIFNPNALPLYRDDSGPFARKRGRPAGGILEGRPAPSAFAERHPDKEDPEAERRARLAAARVGTAPMGPGPPPGDRDAHGGSQALRPGKGAGGILAPDMSLAQWSRQKDLAPGSAEFENPREALLRFAEVKKVCTRGEGRVPMAAQTLEQEIDAEESDDDAADASAKRTKPRAP